MSIRVLALFIIGLAGIAADPAEARCYYISQDGSVVFIPCHHEMPSLHGRGGLPGQKSGSSSGPVEVLMQHDSFPGAAKVCIGVGPMKCCFNDGFECGPAKLETRQHLAQQVTDIHHPDGGRTRVTTHGSGEGTEVRHFDSDGTRSNGESNHDTHRQNVDIHSSPGSREEKITPPTPPTPPTH